MNKDQHHFSSKRVEEAAKGHDVLQRAKAASPIGAGRDVLEHITVRANRDPFGGRYDDTM